MTLDTQSLRPLFTEWARIMEANKSVLTELDSVVGDGDLGLTMSDGFAAAARYAQQSEERDWGDSSTWRARRWPRRCRRPWGR